MHLRENIPLAPLTTLGVGGAARYFAEAATEAEVVEAVAFARSRSLLALCTRRRQQCRCRRSRLRWAGAEDRERGDRAGWRNLHRGRGLRLGQLRGEDDCRKLRWAGMSQRHPRNRGRHAGAERRRLRAGSFRNHHRSSRTRFVIDEHGNPDERPMRLRLSLQPLQQQRTWKIRHPASVVRVATGRRAGAPLPRVAKTFRETSRVRHCQRSGLRCARSGAAKPC